MHGKNVLVVEYEDDLAELMRDMLLEAQAGSVTTASSVAAALQVIASRPIDIATLDVQLGAEHSFAVADVLAARGTPFVFVTVHDRARVPERHAARPFLPKLDRLGDLAQTLTRFLPPPFG